MSTEDNISFYYMQFELYHNDIQQHMLKKVKHQTIYYRNICNLSTSKLYSQAGHDQERRPYQYGEYPHLQQIIVVLLVKISDVLNI